MTERPSRRRGAHTPGDGYRAGWPGIASADGHPDCWYCSWAWRAGRMEVKFVNSMCPVRGHRLVAA